MKEKRVKKTVAHAIADLETISLRSLWPLLLMVLLIVGIYAQVSHFSFLNWDDDKYITNNVRLHALSFDEIGEQFSQFQVGNYHPVTMLSYSLDLKMAGQNASFMHLENVFFHLLNSLLVFVFIYLLTGRPLLSSLSALLYAVHPMRVESVAWVSERKDVLYVFFGLLSLLSILWYVRRNDRSFYLLSILFFILSCLSKAMAVSLVPVLFLVDWYWQRGLFSKKMLLEKIPFITIALITGIIAVKAQTVQKGFGYEQFGVGQRIVIAGGNLFLYMAQSLVPYKLQAFYPYPAGSSIPGYYVLCFVILFVALLITWRILKDKALWFALFFFILNIALVLQLIPVGYAIRADRYTYLPGIGFAFGLVWLLYAFSNNWLKSNTTVLFCAVVVSLSVGLSVISYGRTAVWNNSLTFWSDVLEDNPDFVPALSNRGSIYIEQKEYSKALADFDRVITLQPDFGIAYSNRAVIHLLTKEYAGAIQDFTTALHYRLPEVAPVLANLAYAYNKTGEHQKAIEFSNYSINADSLSYQAWANRGYAYLRLNSNALAEADIIRSLKIRPENGESFYFLGLIHLAKGDTLSACKDFESARKWTVVDESNADSLKMYRLQFCK